MQVKVTFEGGESLVLQLVTEDMLFEGSFVVKDGKWNDLGGWLQYRPEDGEQDPEYPSSDLPAEIPLVHPTLGWRLYWWNVADGPSDPIIGLQLL